MCYCHALVFQGLMPGAASPPKVVVFAPYLKNCVTWRSYQMEPNYLEYSIAELEDALANIDKDEFPDRAARIEGELISRQASQNSSLNTADKEFEPNEQFFKCPTCEKKIGFFSKTANKWGKVKACPHCNSLFEQTLSLKVFAIAIIPALIIHLFILRPLVVAFGLHGAISNGILCGILLILSTRFRKVRNKTVT